MAIQPDENQPTIVLVHGAWADATGFDAEIRALQGQGFRVIGFANPLRDLAADSAYLAEFLGSLTGPIVLVGHSYGGNVISVAAAGNDQVKALVYLNGWLCDEGESQQELLEKFEGSLVGPSVRPVPYTSADGSEGADLLSRPRGVPRGLRRRRRRGHGGCHGCSAAAVRCRRVRRYPVWPAGVEDPAVLVPAGHGRQGDPARAPALHGRARERNDRGGGGLSRLVRVAARRRDPAHPSGRRGDHARSESHLEVTRGRSRARRRQGEAATADKPAEATARPPCAQVTPRAPRRPHLARARRRSP